MQESSCLNQGAPRTFPTVRVVYLASTPRNPIPTILVSRNRVERQRARLHPANPRDSLRSECRFCNEIGGSRKFRSFAPLRLVLVEEEARSILALSANHLRCRSAVNKIHRSRKRRPLTKRTLITNHTRRIRARISRGQVLASPLERYLKFLG